MVPLENPSESVGISVSRDRIWIRLPNHERQLRIQRQRKVVDVAMPAVLIGPGRHDSRGRFSVSLSFHQNFVTETSADAIRPSSGLLSNSFDSPLYAVPSNAHPKDADLCRGVGWRAEKRRDQGSVVRKWDTICSSDSS